MAIAFYARRLQPGGRCTGLSLAELLLAITLLGIFFSLAIPGLRHLQMSRALHTQVNDLVHAIHFARHAALTTGVAISLCPSRDGNRCHYDADWQTGWLLFSHVNGGSRPQVSADNDVLISHTVTSPVVIAANRPAFTLRSYGQRSTNGTFVFCDPREQADARRLVISYTGKPRAERVPAGGLVCRSA